MLVDVRLLVHVSMNLQLLVSCRISARHLITYHEWGFRGAKNIAHYNVQNRVFLICSIRYWLLNVCRPTQDILKQSLSLMSEFCPGL